MEIVTCPQKYSDFIQTISLDQINLASKHHYEQGLYLLVRSLFLGGGISDCPNWQAEIIPRFANTNVILMNPRRDNFDITNQYMSVEQIHWEHEHLNTASAILFWFPAETLCPITLFELGKYATLGKRIFVGCHPDYARALDVRVQLKLIQPYTIVHDSIDSLVAEVHEWINS